MACLLSRMAFLLLMLPMLSMLGTQTAQAQKAGTVALCKDDRTAKGSPPATPS